MEGGDTEDGPGPSRSTCTAQELKSVAKKLCLIRHGHGVHNPRPNPLDLGFLHGMLQKDARLTVKGRQQARALQPLMTPYPFQLVAVSPLSRAIETATEAFHGSPVPKILCPLLCERCMMPADEGTPASQLLSKHPQLESWQGLAELEERFWPKRSLQDAEQEVVERVDNFKQWLLKRPEACVAPVSLWLELCIFFINDWAAEAEKLR
eukprot:CAMPEP_0117688018 /NCGR_PEP_ID=MMETSP0804-20121206/23534_1 /TAXON_ID=1074897 /ORGANISM="Tetraselmis astigmatica, Strain CCMP880" /LENGTH=207 /DNA_ID=CAMNT_0005500299 /DNA_START=65 /DNA_END=685 /DNA_ORIENTATION=+